ncbi:tetratricopeptide repeat protein [Leptospira dzoumogneensis]|uniref:Uncharacterized protein n=1 Tax=Leptospira dzoumogneensis TaxID=2484904 RepID=A0A4Z1ANY5_9LEPT|nr:hypothetical protein [Leptospira dzoumogneensis]TGN00043.1 hypothetical protein EHR06_07950 [Leptospira dzoumogneensis]
MYNIKTKLIFLIICFSLPIFSKEDQEKGKQKCIELSESKKFQESINCFKLLIEEYPNSYNLYDSIGVTYALFGDLKSSKKSFEKAIQMMPMDPGPHRNLGYLYLETKDYVNAIKSFKNVIKTSYNDIKTMDLVANLSMEIKDYESAILYWEEILKIENAPVLYLNIAIAYDKLGDKKNYMKYLEIGCKEEKAKMCEDLNK